MATYEYKATVANRPQIDSITPSGTYSIGDTVTITIGNSALVIRLGTGQTALATICNVIVAAINATTLFGSLVGTERRSHAGQLMGEFKDVVARINPDNSAQVLVYSAVAGVPFGTPSGGNMTVATSGAGSIARASVQTATGLWDWNAAANWIGGAVPSASGHDLVFRYGQGPKYNLPAATYQPASVTVDQTVDPDFCIGLPDINPNDYAEYRQTEVQWDNGHTAATIYTIGRNLYADRLPRAQQYGPQLMRFFHSGTDTLQAQGIIYNTGIPANGMAACFYIRAGGATNTGAFKVLRGFVAFAPGKGELFGMGAHGAFKSLEIGYNTDLIQGTAAVPSETDPFVVIGAGVDINDTEVVISGGLTELRGDIKDSGGAGTPTNLKVAGRKTRLIVAGDGTAAFPEIERINVRAEAEMTVLSEMTVGTSLIVEGKLDLRRGAGKITAGGSATLEIRGAGLIDDPAARLTLSDFSTSMGGGGGGGA